MNINKTIITHENVESNDTNGINYNTIVDQFGCQLITSDIISKIKQITGNTVLHPFIENNIFFAHRDFDVLLKSCMDEKINNFYIYTGRGPSTSNLHLGHMIPFMATKYLQDIFDVPVVIQITDDEKYYQTKSNTTFETYRKYALENIKDIIACGFNPKKTFIFLNSVHCVNFSHNSTLINTKIKLHHLKNIFGFTDEDNIGKISFPIYQMAPSFASSFPLILHPYEDSNPRLDSFYNPMSSFLFQTQDANCLEIHKNYLSQLKNKKCLIIAAIDQDVYFRTLRDIAPKINEQKPIIIYSRFISSLHGKNKKMSSSVNNSAIFLTDSATEIKKKINSAFSGGQETLQLHQELGGNPDIDVAFQYIQYFSEDSHMVNEIKHKFSSGELSSGEMKKKCISIISDIIEKHQIERKKIDYTLIVEYMSIRSII